MEKSGTCDTVVVTSPAGFCLGYLTRTTILAAIGTRKATMSDSVGKIYVKKFKSANQKTQLDTLWVALQYHPVVIVLDGQGVHENGGTTHTDKASSSS